VAARAPKREAWAFALVIGDSPATQTVSVPLLGPEPAADRSAPANLPTEPTTVKAPPDHAARGSALRPTSTWLALGLGASGLAAGAGFALLAHSKNGDSMAYCETRTLCYDRGVELRNEALQAARISTIAFAAGGTLLAGGIVLWATAPRTTTGSSPPATLEASLSGHGLLVRSRW
jgi:hypothetical protein